jgi:hypothetical protein
VSIKVGGEDKLAGRGLIPITQKGFSDKLQIEVAANGELEVVLTYHVLMAAEEEQFLKPMRFVQAFNVSITNRSPVELRVRHHQSGAAPDDRSLFFGQPYLSPISQGIGPGEKCFSFWLSKPAPMIVTHTGEAPSTSADARGSVMPDEPETSN